MSNNYYFCAGIYSISAFSAGFPELRKMAQRWADEDSNFLSLLVRKVSQDDYGIQFIYLMQTEDDTLNPMKTKYLQELVDSFGSSLLEQRARGSKDGEKISKKGLYAWDYHISTGATWEEHISQTIVCQRALPTPTIN